MRKLLQNKAVVLAMSVVAIGMVVWRVQDIRKRYYPPDAVAASPTPAPPPAAAPAPATTPPATTEPAAPDPIAATTVAQPSSSDPLATGLSGRADRTTTLATTTTNSLEELKGRLTSWRTLYPDDGLPRDPFDTARPRSVPKVVVMEDPVFDMDHLQVRAISIEPNGNLALINDGIFGEGDALGEFTVHKILRHEVWLQHERGRIVLKLEFTAQANETSSDDPLPTP